MATDVGRTALKLAPLVVLARLGGFLVPMVIAHLFGVSGVTDAFFYALAWPMLTLVVVTNAIGTVVTPEFARVEARTPSQTGRIVGLVLVATAGFAGIVNLLVASSLSLVAPSLWPGQAPFLEASGRFVLLLLPFMMGVGAAVILRVLTELRGRFAAAAAAPLPRAIGILGALFGLAPFLAEDAMPVALTVGSGIELLWYAAALRGTGSASTTEESPPSLLDTARGVAPVLVGQALAACVLVVDRSFAGGLDEGAVTLLDYADRLRLVPQTLLDGTILPVAYATWSHQLAAGDQHAFGHNLTHSIRWTASVSAPPLAGLFIARFVIMEVLFARGAFTVQDATEAATAFGGYVPGLWFLMWGALCMRAHIAVGRLQPVLVLGAVALGIKIVVDALLVGPLGVLGLTVGSSLMYAVVPSAYLWSIRDHLVDASWFVPVSIVASSAAVAVGVEVVGPPTSLLAPSLWGSAAVLFAVWGLSFSAVERPR